MANEWPADDSENWDVAIANNLNAGHDTNGLHTLGTLSAFDTVTFTKALASADGTTSIVSSLSYQPRQVVFLASVASTSVGSWGTDDGVSAKSTAQNHGGNSASSTSSSINLVTASGTTTAKITELASDGFTVTWTADSAGTATIIALCLK